MHTSVTSPIFSKRLAEALTANREPLLFAVRLWASVCLAMFVAFWLALDNPYWAGGSAAVVCQPQLGASLRKGWFRMIGTVIGAIAIVVFSALFPQDGFGFLVLLALWSGIGAFVSTALRNFASYAAALAGYTTVVIAAGMLGATGGASPDVFLLAVTRASEICIGIVCAGIVLAGTDLGAAQGYLARALAELAAGIAGGVNRALTRTGTEPPQMQADRREVLRRVIALDPVVDQVLGESSGARVHTATLQMSMRGLLAALDAWRRIATHLSRAPGELQRAGREAILRAIPAALRSLQEPVAAARQWMSDPTTLRRECEQGAEMLLALPADTPSLRLLADETVRFLSGIVAVLNGLAMLVGIPQGLSPVSRGARMSVPDWQPALINAARAFVAVGAVELFWVVTGWPSGVSALLFVTIPLLLLSPLGDLAYGGAIAGTLGGAGAVLCVAIVKFAVLPGLETFPAFCLALGLFLLPAGFAMSRSRHPAAVTIFTAMVGLFLPLAAPTNQMSYDTQQFYNSAVTVIVGLAVTAASFRLLPPIPPAVRVRRLLDFALRDLRRIAVNPMPSNSADWDRRMSARIVALPDQAEPLHRAQLLAALSIGTEVIQLRDIACDLGAETEIDASLQALARGSSAIATARLRDLDRHIAASPEIGPDNRLALRARASILVISEALSERASYFDAGDFA